MLQKRFNVRAFTLLICISSFCFACKQKEETCIQQKFRTGSGIIFSGFNLNDLDTIIIKTYTPDNHFNSVISTDTEISRPILQNGLIYRYDSTFAFVDTATSFASIEDTFDISITIPSKNKTYNVHALYGKDTLLVYQAIGCREREMYVAPDAIIVNGAIDTLIELKHFAFIISK